MKAHRLTVLAALLVLLSAVCPVRSADAILVPGNPALTQREVDQERAYLEWVLGLKMSEQTRTLHQRALVADWKEWDRDSRSRFLQGVETWSKMGRASGFDDAWRRTHNRGPVLLSICSKPDLFDALLALDLPSGGAPPADPDRDRVLVPGSALTRGVVDQFSELIEWLFDLELTRVQGAALQELLIDEVKRGDKPAQEGTLSSIRFWGRVGRLNATDRRLVRAAYVPEFVANLPGTKDKTDRWLLSVYQSAYPALTAGDSPLTRWDTDAYAEMFCFQNNQAAGKEVWVADRGFKDSYGKRLAAAYPKASAAEKAQMTQGRSQWETWRAVWPSVSEEDQGKWRTRWAEMYKPVEAKPLTAATVDEARRKAEQAKLAAELEQIRHETVMDIIKRMNPRTDRYGRPYP